MADRKVTLVVRYEAVVDGPHCSGRCQYLVESEPFCRRFRKSLKGHYTMLRCEPCLAAESLADLEARRIAHAESAPATIEFTDDPKPPTP